ncbi:hypothetical protein DWY99_06020 [[Clostridium] leptum]|uniref:Uncharacterized protein n=1 Tax=[Clostridium] leptum TaxID=1535 RepID=A0A412AXP0_9FIRM|nr:hypothetical protein DWY99_06020 [[Clostridium] leptum]
MKKNIRIMIITVAAVIILVAMLLILMNLPRRMGAAFPVQPPAHRFPSTLRLRTTFPRWK